MLRFLNLRMSMELRWFLIPLISATIGWFTNYLAVKMLFRPRDPIKLGPLVLHGVFPKRQNQIASRIGELVAKELLSVRELLEKFKHPEKLESVNDLLNEQIGHYIDTVFPEKFPFIAAVFVREGRRKKLKDEFSDEVRILLPQLIDQFGDQIENAFDIEKTIRERIERMSSSKLEDMLMKVLSNEFKFIEWVGAAVGLLIGLVQVFLLELGL